MSGDGGDGASPCMGGRSGSGESGSGDGGDGASPCVGGRSGSGESGSGESGSGESGSGESGSGESGWHGVWDGDRGDKAKTVSMFEGG